MWTVASSLMSKRLDNASAQARWGIFGIGRHPDAIVAD
jgi:hypothetical protein